MSVSDHYVVDGVITAVATEVIDVQLVGHSVAVIEEIVCLARVGIDKCVEINVLGLHGDLKRVALDVDGLATVRYPVGYRESCLDGCAEHRTLANRFARRGGYVNDVANLEICAALRADSRSVSRISPGYSGRRGLVDDGRGSVAVVGDLVESCAKGFLVASVINHGFKNGGGDVYYFSYEVN